MIPALATITTVDMSLPQVQGLGQKMVAVEREQQQRLLVTENELKSSWVTLRHVRQVAIEAMRQRQKARRLQLAFASFR